MYPDARIYCTVYATYCTVSEPCLFTIKLYSTFCLLQLKFGSGLIHIKKD